MSDLSLNQSLSEPADASAATCSVPVAKDDVRPDVLRWIADQARRGVYGEAVHRALVQQGWSPDYASQAMRIAMESEHPGWFLNPGVIQTHHHPTPEPFMLDGSTLIDAGDRVVEVVMTCMLPRIVVFDGFMSDDECAEMIELARPRMERSSVIQPVSGAGVIDNVRTSTGMFFNVLENDLVTRIESRISRLLHWPIENGEGLQVLNYQAGAEYQPHQDFFDPADAGTPQQLGLAGQRVGTLLMYLNTPPKGGGTVFADAGGLEVKAKKGRAVLFTYDLPLVSKMTRHGGQPVIEGEKWAATKWMRQAPMVPLNVPKP
jgi:prolyl 4-hydroxylase